MTEAVSEAEVEAAANVIFGAADGAFNVYGARRVALRALEAAARVRAPQVAALCPRCHKNPVDPILLDTEAEGYHICSECWKTDRYLQEHYTRAPQAAAEGIGQEHLESEVLCGKKATAKGDAEYNVGLLNKWAAIFRQNPIPSGDFLPIDLERAAALIRRQVAERDEARAKLELRTCNCDEDCSLAVDYDKLRTERDDLAAQLVSQPKQASEENVANWIWDSGENAGHTLSPLLCTLIARRLLARFALQAAPAVDFQSLSGTRALIGIKELTDRLIREAQDDVENISQSKPGESVP